MTRHAIIWAILSSVIAGCGGDQPQPTVATTTPTAPPPEATAAATATPAAGPTRELPKTGDPANHYLQDDVWLIANSAYQRGHLYAHVGAQLAEPSGPKNLAKFYDYYSSKEVERSHFWKSRAAKADEVVPGKVVALLDGPPGNEKIYGAPASVKQAYESRWWLARVVNQRSKADGFVLLAGGYRVAPTALRLLEGDDSPALAKQGKEDAHYIGEEHWFTAARALPTGKGYVYLAPALPVKPDAPLEGGEGVFIETTTGKQGRYSHAWQTRIATKADLKKGQVVIAPELKAPGQQKTYRAPKTRIEALKTRWWAVNIDDVSGLAKGTIGGRGYTFEVGALRVVK
ncbi:MAG: hypothetical protein JRI68_05435 [Deltaproteobacteria bacterium]|nr:hypothetical protein [Deltaproteobacteria bacterium]